MIPLRRQADSAAEPGVDPLELAVVAAGEGGPEQLLRLFRGMAPPRRPVLIVQRNLPVGFTPYLADLVARTVGCACREVKDGDALPAGAIYFVPAGRHAEVSKSGKKLRVRLYEGEKINGSCPAIDPVLASAARVSGLRVTAALLGGRGRDGCDGARAIVAAGGRVLLQHLQSAAFPELLHHVVRFVPSAQLASLELIRSAISQPIVAEPPLAQDSQSLGVEFQPHNWSRLIVVAASTGGPAALLAFLDALDRSFAEPLLIAQHIPAGFSKRLAESLSAATGWRIEVPTATRELCAGTILLAPGDRHLRVVREGAKAIVRLDDSAPIDGNRPAADILFRSAAEALGARVTAVVLTGTGRDGLIGSAAVAQSGGRVLAQDLTSANATAMPRAVIDAKLAEATRTPAGLGALISARNKT